MDAQHLDETTKKQAAELTQEFCFRTLQRREKIEWIVQPQFEEALRLGTPFDAMLKDIKNEQRDRREYLWQFFQRHPAPKRTGAGNSGRGRSEGLTL